MTKSKIYNTWENIETWLLGLTSLVAGTTAKLRFAQKAHGIINMRRIIQYTALGEISVIKIPFGKKGEAFDSMFIAEKSKDLILDLIYAKRKITRLMEKTDGKKVYSNRQQQCAAQSISRASVSIV